MRSTHLCTLVQVVYRGRTYVTPGSPAVSLTVSGSTRFMPSIPGWIPSPPLVRSSTMPRPLSSSSIVPLPLALLLLVQLSVMPVAAQIQAPSCLSAALGVWNWVRISSSSVPIDELIRLICTLADIQQPRPAPLPDCCLSRSRMLQWTYVVPLSCVPSWDPQLTLSQNSRLRHFLKDSFTQVLPGPTTADAIRYTIH